MKKTNFLNFNLSIFIPLIVLVLSCAKERPIEKIPDPDRARLQKAFFLGLNSGNKNKNFAIPTSRVGINQLWFSKVTVIKTSGNGGHLFTGLQTDLKAGYFDFTQEELRYYDAYGPRGRNTQNAPSMINAWGVTHVDTRLRESDGKVTNKEEDNKYLSWRERRLFTVDWSESVIDTEKIFSINDNSCFKSIKRRAIKDEEVISSDYISFVVEVDFRVAKYNCLTLRRANFSDLTYTAQFRYSFKKATPKEFSDYVPYQYSGENDPLQKKYGYFQTIKEFLNRTEDGGDNRFKTKIFMNRWHPQKTHTFYLAEGLPREFIPNIEKLISKTNQLFEENGLDIRFNLNKNLDGQAKFGDLRYSFFKIIPDIDPGGAPFGYGPSDANPFTGEIISANTMIWTGYLDWYVQRVDDELARDQSREKRSIYARMKTALGELPPSEWLRSAKPLSPVLKEGNSGYQYPTISSEIFYYLLPKVTFSLPIWDPFVTTELNRNQTGLLPGLLPGNGTSPFARVENFLNKSMASNLPPIMNFATDTWNNVTDDYQRQYWKRANANRPMQYQTFYPSERHLIDAKYLLAKGLSKKQAKQNIFNRVLIHEFGHNISLRHNFFGSVDKANFRPPAQVTFENDKGNQQTIEQIQNSTSVMEYSALYDEYKFDFTWDDYDKAAIVYAYSAYPRASKSYRAKFDEKTLEKSKEQGQDYGPTPFRSIPHQKGVIAPIDLSLIYQKNYLYCTDQQRFTNAMCKAFDRGSTPSEVIHSIIRNYEDRYETTNYRYGRAYWDTRGYSRRTFQVMYDIKQFLLLWKVAFKKNKVTELLNESKFFEDDINNKEDKIKEHTFNIQQDLIQAVKLSIAFFNSVIQQSLTERPWENRYNKHTDQLERLGTGVDKLWALYFLLDDTTLFYNPNQYFPYASFLAYFKESEISELLEKVLENLITERVDMELGFTSLGRAFYALNAYNYTNDRDSSIIDKIKVSCYSAKTLQERLGIDPYNYIHTGEDKARELKIDVLPIPAGSRDLYFTPTSDNIAILRIGNYFYLTHQTKNPYTYSIISNMKAQPYRFDSPLAPGERNLVEAYNFYHSIKGENVDCE